MFLPGRASNCPPTATLQDDLGMDSLERFELVLQIERRFNIRFLDHELEKVRTIQDLLTGIERRLQQPLSERSE